MGNSLNEHLRGESRVSTMSLNIIVHLSFSLLKKLLKGQVLGLQTFQSILNGWDSTTLVIAGITRRNIRLVVHIRRARWKFLGQICRAFKVIN